MTGTKKNAIILIAKVGMALGSPYNIVGWAALPSILESTKKLENVVRVWQDGDTIFAEIDLLKTKVKE
jgi:hypothetical protein